MKVYDAYIGLIYDVCGIAYNWGYETASQRQVRLDAGRLKYIDVTGANGALESVDSQITSGFELLMKNNSFVKKYYSAFFWIRYSINSIFDRFLFWYICSGLLA